MKTTLKLIGPYARPNSNCHKTSVIIPIISDILNQTSSFGDKRKNTILVLFQCPNYLNKRFNLLNNLESVEENKLTFYCIMLKNGQTYFKNLAAFTLQDF